MASRPAGSRAAGRFISAARTGGSWTRAWASFTPAASAEGVLLDLAIAGLFELQVAQHLIGPGAEPGDGSCRQSSPARLTYSTPVRPWMRLSDSGMKPMSRRSCQFGGRVAVAAEESDRGRGRCRRWGGSKPNRILRSVLLPAPLGPRRPMRPRGSVRVTSFQGDVVAEGAAEIHEFDQRVGHVV